MCMILKDIVIECQNRLVNDIYSQIPNKCKGKISKEDVTKVINEASERFANLMLFGTTDPKITFSIRYSDIIKQAKEEKSDIMYKCWKNTARTIKQTRENV